MGLELDYKLIGVRLRAVRQKRERTQEDVAEQAGISAQHLSGIECGNAKVSLPALIRLCNVLETTPDNIIMDSLPHATPQLMESVSAVFADCNFDEIYILCKIADSAKQAMRDRKPKRGTT